MGLHKGYVFPDEKLACPECGKTFKNLQALTNHQRKHLAENLVADGGKEEEIARLQEEVKVLRLEGEKRRLESMTIPNPPPQDLMAAAGAGAIDGEAKTIAQRRVLGLTDTAPQPQATPESWLSKIISQPGGIETMAKAVKGVLGLNDRGSDSLSILKELGIDLKDLWARSQAPPAGALKIAGLDLTGMPMTPGVLAAILDYQGRKETSEKEAESKEAMAKTWDRMMEVLSPLIAQKFTSGGGAISAPASASRLRHPPVEPEPARIFNCTQCENTIEVPAGAKVGTAISCPSCGSDYEVEVDDTKQQAKPPPLPESIEVKEEKITMKCKCGQMIDVTDVPLLTEVKCPVCHAIAQVTDPDLPLPARPVTQQEKMQSLYEKNRGGLL